MGFSIPIFQLAEKTKTDLNEAVKKATNQIFAAILEESPVDSGRFKANWTVSKDKYTAQVYDTTDISRAEAEVAKALELDAGGIVYMVNSLPYAYRLEYEGWSQQASQGMIRLSIAEFDQYVRRALQ